MFAAGRTDAARGQLVELAAAARSIYVDVREAILGLRSPVIPGVGLVTAVEDYAARFAEASKIAVRVDAPPPPAGSSRADVEAQVFRIVQEALTNVRKHAGAQRAEVGFDVRDGGLEVVIRDDGHGGEAPPPTTIGPGTGCARCANAPRASAPRWTG